MNRNTLQMNGQAPNAATGKQGGKPGKFRGDQDS